MFVSMSKKKSSESTTSAMKYIAKPDIAEEPEVSDFESLAITLERAFPLLINFDDLSGITLDIDNLALADGHRNHVCSFCMLLKGNDQGYDDCIRNRCAVARLARKRMTSFWGTCHAGLFEIVQPLVYHGHYLGKFHYGSVVLKDSVRGSRKRLRNYCRKRDWDPKPHLKAFAAVPVIDKNDIPFYKRTLGLVANVVTHILIGHGLPAERYMAHHGFVDAKQNRTYPVIVRKAIEHVNMNYRTPLTLESTAGTLECRSDYLSRIFKKTLGVNFHDNLRSVRLGHARYLLEEDTEAIGEIGFIVGFQTASHFNRVFKHAIGVTPGQYREQQRRAKISTENPSAK